VNESPAPEHLASIRPGRTFTEVHGPDVRRRSAYS
jgi:hypothetical protein